MSVTAKKIKWDNSDEVVVKYAEKDTNGLDIDIGNIVHKTGTENITGHKTFDQISINQSDGISEINFKGNSSALIRQEGYIRYNWNNGDFSFVRDADDDYLTLNLDGGENYYTISGLHMQPLKFPGWSSNVVKTIATTDNIPDDSNLVHKIGNEIVNGVKTFSSIEFSNSIGSDTYNSWISEQMSALSFRTRKGDSDLTQGNIYVNIPTLEDSTATNIVINFPAKNGIVALTDDIPSVADFVTGPASSTDNAIARFDSTTGKIIQNSGITIDDDNNLKIPNQASNGRLLFGMGTGTNGGPYITSTNGGVGLELGSQSPMQFKINGVSSGFRFYNNSTHYAQMPEMSSWATDKTIATTDDIVGKANDSDVVHKTGDTISGTLNLQNSTYSASPYLGFINAFGTGSLYKETGALKFVHNGADLNYTITFPTKTGVLTTLWKHVVSLEWEMTDYYNEASFTFYSNIGTRALTPDDVLSLFNNSIVIKDNSSDSIIFWWQWERPYNLIYKVIAGTTITTKTIPLLDGSYNVTITSSTANSY